MGVSAWVKTHGDENHDSLDYSSRELGYTRVDGKWGLAIRSTAGNHSYPDQDKIEVWAFSDASRLYRLDAVDRIPDLIEELVKRATDITAKTVAKTEMVKLLAEALTPPVPPRRPTGQR